MRRMGAFALGALVIAGLTATAALVAASRTPVGRYWTAVLLLESGQHSGAERIARQLVADPAARSYGHFRLLAAALRRQDKVDEQLAMFDEAVAVFPDLDIAHGHRCWYYALYGHAAAAMDSCDTAVELATQENAGKIRLWRGAARYLAGDRGGAIEDLQAAQQAWSTGSVSTHDYERAARRWLEALGDGRDILDERELERLRRWF